MIYADSLKRSFEIASNIDSAINNCLQTIMEIIDKQPDVDAVEVVHCRDCKYSMNNNQLCVRKVNAGGIHAMDKVYPGFYCKAGKRRDSDG